MKEFFQCLKQYILKQQLTSFSRFLNPPGRFPPPPAVKASLSVTKELARSKSAKSSITLVFILGEVYGEFALLLKRVDLPDGQVKL